MKKKLIAIFLCIILTVGFLPTVASAEKNQEEILILYENDVHCAIEGYSKLSAMKKELQKTHAHVGAVSCGDYIQGNSIGVVSQGSYVIELMNLVGYDAVTLGNHEFDFRLPRLEELIGMMDAAAVCCNFKRIGEAEPYFDPYTIVSYGDVRIAYIGITTPSTIKTSSPTQFKDENGNHVFTFQPTTLYDAVQEQIDAARAADADYVIALSHIGYAEDENGETVEDIETLIQSTHGLDVVLDGHSHSVIEGKTVTDKSGDSVLLSSTGTKFEYIGKLTLSQGTFTTELIKTEDYPNTDPTVDAYIEQIYSEYSEQGERKVAYSQVDLITHDEDGNRLIRKSETNLGNLCAEAFRSAVDADIGYINGGGIRAEIPKGDVTFNDLLKVLPFNNTVVLGEIRGQTLKDVLEMAMMRWPEEGSFPHLSGVTFSLNTACPSSVVLNEMEEFVEVSGPYRVYDIKVLNRETGVYEPLDLSATYTIASHNYYLIEHGSGLVMLEDVKILQDEGILDVESLERYIVDHLGGVIGEEYGTVRPCITYTDGEVIPSAETESPDVTEESGGVMVWIVVAVVGVLLMATLTVFLVKKKK